MQTKPSKACSGTFCDLYFLNAFFFFLFPFFFSFFFPVNSVSVKFYIFLPHSFSFKILFAMLKSAGPPFVKFLQKFWCRHSRCCYLRITLPVPTSSSIVTYNFHHLFLLLYFFFRTPPKACILLIDKNSNTLCWVINFLQCF